MVGGASTTATMATTPATVTTTNATTATMVSTTATVASTTATMASTSATTTSTAATTAKKKPSQICLAKALDKAVRNYAEQGGQGIVCLRVSNGEVIIDGESSSIRAVEEKEYYTDLKQTVLSSEGEGNYTKVENNLPKLKAPLDLEEEEKYWTDKSVKEQVKLYLSIIKWKKNPRKACLVATFNEF